jgi:hypothetical protein
LLTFHVAGCNNLIKTLTALVVLCHGPVALWIFRGYGAEAVGLSFFKNIVASLGDVRVAPTFVRDPPDDPISGDGTPLYGMLTNHFYDDQSVPLSADGMLWDFDTWAPLGYRKPATDMLPGWSRLDFGEHNHWMPLDGAVHRRVFARVQSGQSAANPTVLEPAYRNILCWIESFDAGNGKRKGRYRLRPPDSQVDEHA